MKTGNIGLLAVMTVLALASCQKLIVIGGDDDALKLQLNGFIDTADSIHSVSVMKIGYTSMPVAVGGAKLRCFVNGAFVCEVDTLVDCREPYREYVRYLRFKAAINPGDEVFLSVDADGMHAEVLENVPARLPSVHVDTSTVVRNAGRGSEEPAASYRINIGDRPGRDYYRLRILMYEKDAVEEVRTDDIYGVYPEVGTVMAEFSEDLKIDKGDEPVLGRGPDYGDASTNGPEQDPYSENAYNIFMDSSFDGRPYQMTVYTKPFSNIAVKPTMVLFPGVVWHRVTRRVTVRLQAISRDTYYYIDDYLYDRSSRGLTVDDFYQPYPENVMGGRGLVMFAASTDVVFELPELLTDDYHDFTVL